MTRLQSTEPVPLPLSHAARRDTPPLSRTCRDPFGTAASLPSIGLSGGFRTRTGPEESLAMVHQGYLEVMNAPI
jgi:hypothetical protein